MSLELFARGPLAELAAEARRRLLERSPADAPDLAADVASLMDEVRRRGDEALLEMAERFDGARLSAIEVERPAWEDALAALPDPLRRAMERAARNIRAFHAAQLPVPVEVEVEPGVVIQRRWTPLASVGVYAPGGRAAYPSSVLMGVIPAAAAGVDEIVVCSPPGPDGLPSAGVRAACALAGATRLFAVGGAGAVAAMVWGTQTVPAVDAVVGPGNRWVTEAKRQVAGRVLIDAPAGPSEILVVADRTADAGLVARELLAQAEHDPDAAAVLVTTHAPLADGVAAALDDLLAVAPRADIARSALARQGALLTCDSLEEALAFARAYAPEHLAVVTAHAEEAATRVPTAGTVFAGRWSSVAFGDYITGANHVLPTGGRSRSFSGLSVHHMLRSFTVQSVAREAAAAMADDVAVFAEAEGLPAHAEAARSRSRP